MRKQSFHSLTGIRGVAAVWVLLFHAQQNAGMIFGLPFLEKISVFTNGWHGVDLFFMLSGFILMYAHESDFAKLRKENIVRFARLRITRVYPLNAVVLFLIAIFVIFQGDYVTWARTLYGPATYTFGAFVSTLFLTTRWFIPNQGDFNQPVWSLSVEVLGYMAFPFLAFYAQRIARKWQLVTLASLCLIASFAIMRQFAFQAQITQIACVRMASCFICGILVFRLWAMTNRGGQKWGNRMVSIALIGIAISVMGLFNHGQAFHGDIQINFLFAFLLYGLSFQQGIVHKALASPFAVFLGKISFPLYLFHVTPLLWLRYFLLAHGAAYSTLWKALFLAGWALGSILVATLLHYWMENPFHQWGRRWAGAPAVPASA